MASIGHVAIGMALGRALVKPGRNATAAMTALSVVSLAPDLDAIGLAFGIPYGDPLGHRGATHSLTIALFIALGSYVYAVRKKWEAPRKIAAFTAIVALSHPLLDTMTFGGGLGCALLWPFSNTRFWAPDALRFIPIAPIGAHLLSLRGIYVMACEVVIFAPFWLYAILARRKPEPE